MSKDKPEKPEPQRPTRKIDESIDLGDRPGRNQVYDTLKPPHRPKPKPETSDDY